MGLSAWKLASKYASVAEPLPRLDALAITPQLAGGGPPLRYGLLREGRGGGFEGDGPSEACWHAGCSGEVEDNHPSHAKGDGQAVSLSLSERTGRDLALARILSHPAMKTKCQSRRGKIGRFGADVISNARERVRSTSCHPGHAPACGLPSRRAAAQALR